ncbi:MAG: hypothetical protein AD742_00620 [Methylibium sp. NZG]|nr:MAG: hypothetical protein AD742_00620 [Methylibium sp. NZG]
MTPPSAQPHWTARLRARLAAGAALVSLVLGCGGVGQDGTGAVPDTQTTGVVSGFGSVIVGGIRFDVSTAQISIDGTAGATQADLRVGMVVSVTGSLNADGTSGTARQLTYESLLRGNIDDAPGASSLRVLGQRVQIDPTTVFSSATGIGDLRLGDRLQVSGFRNPDGSLRATWVQRESAGGSLQFTGFVSAVAGNTLTLGGVNLDISRAARVGFGAAAPTAGQLLRVVLEAAPVAGNAAASRITLIDTSTPGGVQRQQLQGIVSQWDAGTGRFLLNGGGGTSGQPVQVSATTQFQDGTLADLANGKRVEVRGTRASDGVLQAERLEFYRDVLTAYGRGRVTAVDVAGLRFNVLDLPGVEVRLRAGTLLDDSSVMGGVLTLANLAVGDEVLVLGRAGTSGSSGRIEADLVQRLPRITPGAGVGGPVAQIAGTSITVLGTNVTTNTADFFDAQGQAVTQAVFFATLQQGDAVRAEGVYLAGALVARTVRRVP